tara:strand:+ start:1751 stop:2500 length:750 start_codon:yes stop_codon:yes gene_type:complete
MDNKYTNYILNEENKGSRQESIEDSNNPKNPNINVCVNAVWNHFEIITNSKYGHTFYDTSEALRDSKHSFGIELRNPIKSKSQCPHCDSRNCTVPQGLTRKITLTPQKYSEEMWNRRYENGDPYYPMKQQFEYNHTTKEMHDMIKLLQDKIDNSMKSFGKGIKTNSFQKIAEALWMTLDSDDRQKYIPVGFRYGVRGHIIGLDTKGFPVVDTAPTYGSKYTDTTSFKQRREKRAGKVFTLIFRERASMN